MGTVRVREWLEEARSEGFLGPGPVDAHIDHAADYVEAYRLLEGREEPRCCLDLGSGGGVPGLVLASVWRSASFVLLDGSSRRAAFLSRVVAAEGLAKRVRVVAARAEEAGRWSELRGAADLVVTRSFGPPAVVAECAAPLLEVGGWLIVSEPPPGSDRSDRWPADRLALVGLSPATDVLTRFHLRAFRQDFPCSDRYPRRVGVPSKRPLF